MRVLHFFFPLSLSLSLSLSSIPICTLLCATLFYSNIHVVFVVVVVVVIKKRI